MNDKQREEEIQRLGNEIEKSLDAEKVLILNRLIELSKSNVPNLEDHMADSLETMIHVSVKACLAYQAGLRELDKEERDKDLHETVKLALIEVLNDWQRIYGVSTQEKDKN